MIFFAKAGTTIRAFFKYLEERYPIFGKEESSGHRFGSKGIEHEIVTFERETNYTLRLITDGRLTDEHLLLSLPLAELFNKFESAIRQANERKKSQKK